MESNECSKVFTPGVTKESRIKLMTRRSVNELCRYMMGEKVVV